MNQENNIKITNNERLQSKKSEIIISTIAFCLFAVCTIIILSTFLYGSTSSVDSSASGWLFVIAIWISIFPLFASFILSVISVVMYLKDKNSKTRVRKILYILNWITIVILFIPLVFIFVIYR